MARFDTHRWLPGALALIAWSSASGETFTFDRDVEGWQVFDIHYLGQPLANPQPVATPAFDAGNGLPPGSVRVGDMANETWIGATAAVAGDRSGLYGMSSVSYDVYYRYADAETYAAVGMHGAGLSLYQAHEPPAVNVWLHWDFPLVVGGWRVGTIGGAVATEAQLLAVLADLEGIFIHTEWRTGPDDTNVDNIAIGPSCIADLDGSGVVDGADLGILLGQWGAAGSADFDGSGTVDGADLGALLGAWGEC